MGDIDFQNGFICGMATKGLVRSGELYKPLVWNDGGVYDYFYIDFRQVVSDFSPAQFAECVKVYGNAGEIAVTKAEKLPDSDIVVKVFCNISVQTSGVNIYGRSNSWLTFGDGKAVPAFVVPHTVAGLATTLPLAYVFEVGKVLPSGIKATEDALFLFYDVQDADISEIGLISMLEMAVAENVIISYS